jgi:hypothetical protein
MTPKIYIFGRKIASAKILKLLYRLNSQIFRLEAASMIPLYLMRAEHDYDALFSLKSPEVNNLIDKKPPKMKEKMFSK